MCAFRDILFGVPFQPLISCTSVGGSPLLQWYMNVTKIICSFCVAKMVSQSCRSGVHDRPNIFNKELNVYVNLKHNKMRLSECMPMLDPLLHPWGWSLYLRVGKNATPTHNMRLVGNPSTTT
jgi:hypothetical protein